MNASPSLTLRTLRASVLACALAAPGWACATAPAAQPAAGASAPSPASAPQAGGERTSAAASPAPEGSSTAGGAITASAGAGGTSRAAAGSSTPGGTLAEKGREPGASAGGAGASKRHRLGPPSKLPPLGRALIAEHMESHGDDMTMLLWSVLFVDGQSTHDLAQVLASEPLFSRPIDSGDSTVNALLPDKFFVLQDAFAKRARQLLATSSHHPRDAAAIARAFGALTETCVACHSVYLNEGPGASPPGPPGLATERSERDPASD